ncbi:MAG: IS1182 family transposase, partial [Planctomycetes bacterium]|nr:IS1182 family transposase [Planctomycetota bacterium]
MGGFRTQEDRRQGLLLPPSPSDWLPEGHLAWFVIDAVEQLDIDSLLGKYRVCGKGELAYPPRVMLALLIYGYCTGTFASRKIAAQIEDSVAFRVIAAGLSPSHRTICRFREENLDEFHRLFVQVVQLAKEAGLVKMGTIAVDGSKVKANASKHKAMSYDRMLLEEKKLRSEIRKLTQAARDQDDIDDDTFGPDFRGDELPSELANRKTRLKTIQAAKKRLEERKAVEAAAKQEAEKGSETATESSKSERVLPQPRDQENFTDPDSRIMPMAGKVFQQSYNAQIAVDAKAQIVVAATVSQNPKDMGLLMPVVNAAYESADAIPKRVLADTGYKNERDLQMLEQLGIDGYVSLGREGKAVRLPSAESPCSQAMLKKLRTKRGRARYKQRKAIVEPVFGWVKHVLGFRAFSLRGVRKVAGEWSLVCLALNLRRMAARGVAV